MALKDVTKAQLLEAAELAFDEALSWLHDQYDGTRVLEEALEDLKPIKDVIELARRKD
jgi:hypothetical protein